MTPLVSVIVPTIRQGNLQRCIEYFKAQDYPNKELIIVPGEGSIGYKRNLGCAEAKGHIIAHFDDDDFYNKHYLSRCVEFLLNSGAQLTGLSAAYFYNGKDNKAWHWVYGGSMPYVCEATMVYYKSFWEERNFPDTSNGEGQTYLQGRSGIMPNNHINLFVANIHGGNTASQHALSSMQPMRPEIPAKIISLG